MNVINKSTLENKKSPWLEQKFKKKKSLQVLEGLRNFWKIEQK